MTTLLSATELSTTRVVALIIVGGVSFSIAALIAAKDYKVFRYVSLVDIFPRLVVILGISWAVPITIGCIAWPQPRLEFYVESSPRGPFSSVFNATLISGPDIAAGYKMDCWPDIVFGKNAAGLSRIQNSQSAMNRPFKSALRRGETTGDACLRPVEVADPVCIDVVVTITAAEDEGKQGPIVPLGAERFVSWKSDNFIWHKQPTEGPKDGGYCDYGVP